jgi:hypothetical protein
LATYQRANGTRYVKFIEFGTTEKKAFTLDYKTIRKNSGAENNFML